MQELDSTALPILEKVQEQLANAPKIMRLGPHLVPRKRAEDWLTVGQVADRLSLCKATVYRLCDEGSLGHHRVKNSIRISEEDLGHFLTQQRQAAP